MTITREQYLRLLMKGFNKGFVAGIESFLGIMQDLQAQGVPFDQALQVASERLTEMQVAIDMLGEMALSSTLVDGPVSSKNDARARAAKLLEKITQN